MFIDISLLLPPPQNMVGSVGFSLRVEIIYANARWCFKILPRVQRARGLSSLAKVTAFK